MVFNERDRQFLRQNPDVTEEELRQIKRRYVFTRLLITGVFLLLGVGIVLIIWL